MELTIIQNHVEIVIQTGPYTSAAEQTFARNIIAYPPLGRIDRAVIAVDTATVWIYDDSTVTTQERRFGVKSDTAVNLCRTFRQMFPDEFNKAETAAMTKKYAAKNN